MDQEGGDPRAILPTEIWHPILQHLKDHPDPRDLIDAAESCTLFASILKDHVNSHRLAEVIPLVLQWLGHRDRLICRCVSKRVSRSVDSIMDHLFRVAPNQNLGLFQSRFFPPRIPPSFENTHFGRMYAGADWRRRLQMEAYDSKMAALSANGPRRSTHPIVGRSLCIVPLLELEMGRDFLEDCIQRLPDYRDALGYVNLVGCSVTGNLIETYDFYCRILSALPNLYYFRGVGADMSGLVGVAENVTSLGRHIAGNPMPAMRVLEEISLIESCSPVPAPLVTEISTRYGGQLKRLSSAQAAGVPEPGDFVQDLVTFPTLTHLNMINCQDDRRRYPPMILMNLQADNLVDLRLKMDMRSPTGSMLPEVVQYLRRFPRLISLSMDMTYMMLNGLRSRKILAGTRLPSVKELNVTTQHCQLPLAFFTALFPNLESFRLGGNLKDDKDLCYDEFMEDFDLLMAQRGFECDVWERCQSLKRFRFRCDHELDSVYTREDGREIGSQFRRQQHLRKAI